MRGRAWLARDGRTLGYLEVAPRPYVIGWTVTRLAVRGAPEMVVGPLVQAAVGQMQRAGVPRLFARCTEDGASELARHGFQSLTREYVLSGPGCEAEEVNLPGDSRYRMPADAWPLHQLEQDLTPSPVRQLEGLSSVDWSPRGRDMTEIVVEQNGRLVAWIGWSTSRRGRRGSIGLMVHPDRSDMAPILLQHVLRQVPCHCRLTARVREYQGETIQALSDAGFTVMGEEILMVKTARVEMARTVPRVKVVGVPSMNVFHTHSSAPDNPAP